LPGTISEPLKKFPENPRQATDQPISSSEDRYSRDNCLIFVGMSEPTSASSEGKIIEDQHALKSYVSRLFDNGEAGLRVVSAFCLGKKMLRKRQGGAL
jgi:hypothetical protein